MLFSAGTSGAIHVVIVVASLVGIPALELAFEEKVGKGAAQDVLEYGEQGEFRAKFSAGALNSDSRETTSDVTESGIDPDSNSDTDSAGEYGFDEPGDAPEADTAEGKPEDPFETDNKAGGGGQGTDETSELASDGTGDESGDSGDSEEAGETMREIVVFIDLRPEPDPNKEPVPMAGEANQPIVSDTDGDAMGQVAALAESDERVSGASQSGDPDGLEDGETEEGRKSEADPSLAVAPNQGEISPPDSALAYKTEEIGSAPETADVADQPSLTSVQTTTGRDPAEAVSGTESPIEETTVAEQATGQPGVPDQDNALEPEETPLEDEVEPQPELTETVPDKEIAGENTPATPRENRDQLLQPEERGKALAQLGGQASGIPEYIEGERGPLNEIEQSEVLVAEGNRDAQQKAEADPEAREGVLEQGMRDAEKTDGGGTLSDQIAALQPGDEFRAQDKGVIDRSALMRGVPDPLAKVIAEIAGDDDAYARAILEGPPLDTAAGNPDPGQLRTNDVLEKAAEAGLAKAQTLMAKRYLLGLVEGGDPDKLVELLRNAAERGDVEAQLLLGALFADGRVVPRDMVQAHVFFDLAAARGSTEAAKNMLPFLERQMEPREVVDSRRLAREYQLFLDATAEPRSRGSNGDGLRDQLLDAAAAGNTAKIAELLSRGTDLEGQDVSGRTAVINAAWRGEQNVVDLLVELEADLNVADYEGRTAVSWAASNGHAEIVKKLLQNGALPDVVDNQGLTPLMRAAWNGHDQVVRLLIDGGAQVAKVNEEGKTALDYALEGGYRDIARVLRAYGA